MSDRTDHVLAAIDGALADDELRDGMRWSPEPAEVTDAYPMPYDGTFVPIPPQHYEDEGLPVAAFGQAFERIAEALRPLFDAIATAGQQFVDALPGLLRPRAPPRTPTSPEEIRARALEIRRAGHGGPRPAGPERSHAPRRLAR